MKTIDGSQGEGGGQILRSALALSLITGDAFRIEHIRAGRKRPGMLRQHLTAVLAAARIGGAEVSGAALHASWLEFRPRALRAGEYRFEIGSAGSVCLVLQAVLPALLMAPAASRLEIEGGTHVPFAPTWDFFSRVLVPVLRRMGAQVRVELQRPGFMPAGGGSVVVEVEPSALRPLEILERGRLCARRATAWIAHIERRIAQRELERVGRSFELTPEELCIRDARSASCPGNALTLELESEHVTELVSALGQKGRPAESVAREVVSRARRYLARQAPIGDHLADQLLIPMAIAGGGTFCTSPLSLHARTNIDVLRAFAPVEVTLRGGSERGVTVELEARAAF